MRLVVPLVVDYSTSRRLVVDYFASATRPGASAHRAARHAVRRATRRRLLHLTQVRRRLLRLCRASGCLGTSRSPSRGSSSTTPHHAGSSSTTPPRAGSSSTTPPRTGSSSTTPPRAGSSSTTPPRAGSSSTTSPPPRIRVPRHVASLVVDNSASRRLVVDYFAYAA
jgi:hypothetical protein